MIWVQILLLFFVSSCASLPTSCSFNSWPEPYNITTGGTLFELNGLGGTVRPMLPDGSISATAEASWWLVEVQELTKNPDLGPFCQIGDPESNKVNPEMKLNRYFDPSNATCEFEIITSELAPGINITSYSVTAYWSEFPDFKLQFNMSTVTSKYEFTYTDTTFTGGIPYTIRYDPSRIKLSFSIDNWPWAGTNLQSYLVMFSNFSSQFAKPSRISQNVSIPEIQFFVTDGETTINQMLDNFAVIQGFPIIRGFQPFEYGLTQAEVPAGKINVAGSNVSTCLSSPIPQFSSFYYDPQFSALFSPAAPTPQTRSGSNRKTVIIASTTTAVLLVAVIGTIVLLAVYVPAVKAYFRPFAARKHKKDVSSVALTSSPASSDKLSSESKTIWQPAQKQLKPI